MVFNRTSVKQAITIAAASTGLCAIVFSFLSRDFDGMLPISVFISVLVVHIGFDLMGRLQSQP